MNLPRVVSPAEWETAHAALLVKEKEATRARDALAAQRRRLPMVRVDKEYEFDGPEGPANLLDLFDGRRQLIVYHHMLQPSDDDPCSGCGFDADFGVTTGFGLNVFLRDGAEVFRTYFTTGRGAEILGSNWSFLDLTPLGRQENWEDSPEGRPQTSPYEWWRLHDEYPA